MSGMNEELGKKLWNMNVFQLETMDESCGPFPGEAKVKWSRVIYKIYLQSSKNVKAA